MNDSLLDTIKAKSDQLNADDLIGGPITVNVLDVVRNKSKDQPVSIIIDGDNQPYKPNLTMRRLIIAGWGDKGKSWIGKSLTLFRNPNVKWAGKCVGGIEVSHMSHIDADFEVALATARGKKTFYKIQKLDVKTSNNFSDNERQWAEYCKDDPKRLEEIEDPAYRAKIKSMISGKSK